MVNDAKARRLVLVGGGHSHALVLRSLGEHPDPALRVTLVAPARTAIYSGMVPGVIAGLYALREAEIDLERLAQRARAARVLASAIRIDAAQRVVELSDGARLPYDLASFDIGSEPAQTAPVEPGAPLVSLKPIDAAVLRLDEMLGASTAADRSRIVVVGAGVGGTEVAFALAARRRDRPGRSIALCDGADRPVSERGGRTAAVVSRALRARQIDFIGGARVARVARDAVHLDDGRVLGADLVVWATGAGGTRLFAASGLPVDTRGCLFVSAELCCPAHPEIFAAGDCATLLPYPDLPKAGVYAVREAPIVDHNLRARARGTPLRSYSPQRRFLALLNTCDGRAVLSYAGLAWRGRAAWRLKDWIDRRFVAQFRQAM